MVMLAIPSSSFIPHPSSLTESHAKINEDSKLKPIARRHIRAGLNSHSDFSDIECLRRH